jgi:hypothetical protein
MEQHLGRQLSRCEHVHHENENKKDNRISNLKVVNISEHIRHHHQKHPIEFTCEQCLTVFRPRPGHRGRYPRFCSKKCFGLSRRKYRDEFIRELLIRKANGESFAELGVDPSSLRQLKKRLQKQDASGTSLTA